MKPALPAPPPNTMYEIFAPITADSAAIDPSEKSNLPLFKLIDSAMVVTITMAVYTTKLLKLLTFVIICCPFPMQITSNMIAAITGIARVPVILFDVLILSPILSLPAGG